MPYYDLYFKILCYVWHNLQKSKRRIANTNENICFLLYDNRLLRYNTSLVALGALAQCWKRCTNWKIQMTPIYGVSKWTMGSGKQSTLRSLPQKPLAEIRLIYYQSSTWWCTNCNASAHANTRNYKKIFNLFIYIWKIILSN